MVGPVRVLSIGSMYPPHHLGGYELMWQSAVEAMRARGHDVWVLASDYGTQDEPDLDRRVRRELHWYWRDHGFPAVSLRERRDIERLNQETLATGSLEEIEPDLVSFWAMGGMSMSLVERVRRDGLPAIGNVHEDWMLYGPRADAWQRAFGRRPLDRLAELATGVPTRLGFEDAALWLFNSEATRAAALGSVGSGAIRGDHAGRRPRPVSRGARARLVRKPLVRRGGSTRARGWRPQSRPCRSCRNRALRIVGPGDRGARRGAAANRRGSRARGARLVRPRLAERSFRAVFAEADALLFPVTWEEPWGLVPLEAMAMGTPVIASGRGGSAEFLRDGENSIVYSPAESASALAGAVSDASGRFGSAQPPQGWGHSNRCAAQPS